MCYLIVLLTFLLYQIEPLLLYVVKKIAVSY